MHHVVLDDVLDAVLDGMLDGMLDNILRVCARVRAGSGILRACQWINAREGKRMGE